MRPKGLKKHLQGADTQVSTLDWRCALGIGSSRKPRCVGAIATYLNAGLWGSRFVGDCEVSTNGERVWLKGRRMPAWMAWARVLSYVAFLPVAFFTGVLLGETLLGHRGYPPYYYLASLLLTFLLVVLGMWGAGIWHTTMGSYEAVSWPVARGRALGLGSAGKERGRRTLWTTLNSFIRLNRRMIQVEVPIGPNGKPRRLILRARDTEIQSLMLVLSGTYYGPVRQEALQLMDDVADPWSWSRN